MSSGLGVKGTLGRCYPFYADIKKGVVRFDFFSFCFVSFGSIQCFWFCLLASGVFRRSVPCVSVDGLASSSFGRNHLIYYEMQSYEYALIQKKKLLAFYFSCDFRSCAFDIRIQRNQTNQKKKINSKRRRSTVRRTCAGRRMKITLNVSMASKKSNGNSKSSKNGNVVKS